MLPTPPEGLRHWEPADAPALEAAWTDPTIVARNPPPAGLTAAEWIAGVGDRWERRLALDLVIDVEGAVAGEVGLRNFTSDPARAELGIWVAERFRRRGVARRAVDAATRWALRSGLEQVWARTETDNAAAEALFESLGWPRLGTHDHYSIWAASVAVLG